MKRWFVATMLLLAGPTIFAVGLFSLAQAQAPTVRSVILDKRPAPASAGPIAFISGVATPSSNATSVTSATLDSTGANFLIACVSNFGGGADGTVTDNKSNTWNLKTRFIGGVSSVQCSWSKPTSVGSGHTVSNTSTQPSIGFAAFSNVNASPFDTEVGTNGASTNPAGGSITPSANGALLVSSTGNLTDSSGSIDSSFILIGSYQGVSGNNFGFGMAYFLQTTAAAINPTWTVSNGNPWAAVNLAFKH